MLDRLLGKYPSLPLGRIPKGSHPLTGELERLRTVPGLSHYTEVNLDLGVARSNAVFLVPGDTLLVAKLTGSLSIQFNENNNPSVNLALVRRTFTPFERFYLTNAVQAGKEAVLYVGRDASFIGEAMIGSVKLLDPTGTEIELMGAATTPVIYNVSVINANTEYSQALSTKPRKFNITTRDRSAFRVAFTTGKVAAPTEPYLTITAGESYFEDLIKPTALTLYFACPIAGKNIEIVEWT